VRPLAGGRVLQGNLDPAALLAPRHEIERRVVNLLAEGAGGGHIVNLGHGILPMTPVEHARAFVELAQRLSAETAVPLAAAKAKQAPEARGGP
jgi:uroporphyrinogen decarboxylase